MHSEFNEILDSNVPGEEWMNGTERPFYKRKDTKEKRAVEKDSLDMCEFKILFVSMWKILGIHLETNWLLTTLWYIWTHTPNQWTTTENDRIWYVPHLFLMNYRNDCNWNLCMEVCKCIFFGVVNFLMEALPTKAGPFWMLLH